MSQDNIVEFNHVQKSYDGETLVVKDLNLHVARGEFLTLLGPSGSGKTTVLMMLAGFEVPTHGEILLNGTPINAVPPHKRGIGMVFQNYALFPHMTVAENLRFPLDVRDITRADAEKKVQRALDMVRLGQFGNRRPGQLSGGQQQRVAVARALVFDPDLVLMDEPLGALDKNLREEMQLEIKHIHEQLGVSVVYVTHDQSEALTMSNRIAVFDDGVIQQLAAPDQLYEQPENAFVAYFIGENNRLRGTVKSANGQACEVELENGGGTVKALPVNIAGEGQQDHAVAASGAGRGEPRQRRRQYLRRQGRGADLPRRPYPHACAGLRQRRVRDQDSQHPWPGPDQKGDTVKVGWACEDCRALDA